MFLHTQPTISITSSGPLQSLTISSKASNGTCFCFSSLLSLICIILLTLRNEFIYLFTCLLLVGRRMVQVSLRVLKTKRFAFSHCKLFFTLGAYSFIKNSVQFLLSMLIKLIIITKMILRNKLYVLMVLYLTEL